MTQNQNNPDWNDLYLSSLERMKQVYVSCGGKVGDDFESKFRSEIEGMVRTQELRQRALEILDSLR